MVRLQELQERHADDLVVLGFNCSDDSLIARRLLAELEVSYRTVLDASDEARAAAAGYRMSGVPLNYVIDREGRVADAWYGGGQERRGVSALARLGLR
jgi:hypothetical protein